LWPLDRNERDHIHRAEARVLASVRTEIDGGDSPLEKRQHCLLNAC